MGRARLTYDKIFTLLLEVENVINCRPLTHISDSNDESFITPYQLMYVNRMQNVLIMMIVSNFMGKTLENYIVKCKMLEIILLKSLKMNILLLCKKQNVIIIKYLITIYNYFTMT